MSRTSRRRALLVLTAVLAMGLLSACSTMTGFGGPVEIAITSSTGTSGALALTDDATASDATGLPVCLPVTFGAIHLVPEGEDAEPIPLTDEVPDFEATVDLMALAGGSPQSLEDVPEAITVPAGIYAQVRFIVTDAFVGITDAACDPADLTEGLEPVFVPSGMQTGMKVNLHPHLIVPPVEGDGSETTAVEAQTVVLDFDVDRLVQTGRTHPYVLTPTAVRAYPEAEQD